ncbi:MAG TPA: hypothetical protein VF335_04020, partial [Chitinivibrionales bacterium]
MPKAVSARTCTITILFSIFFFYAAAHSAAPVPTTWSPRGVGGGGSLYSPSINPADTNEFYVACDMSELFHTNDFGASYETVPFYQMQGGPNAVVRFTSNAKIRYAVSCANDMTIPVKSIDGGATWTAL